MSKFTNTLMCVQGFFFLTTAAAHEIVFFFFSFFVGPIKLKKLLWCWGKFQCFIRPADSLVPAAMPVKITFFLSLTLTLNFAAETSFAPVQPLALTKLLKLCQYLRPIQSVRFKFTTHMFMHFVYFVKKPNTMLTRWQLEHKKRKYAECPLLRPAIFTQTVAAT